MVDSPALCRAQLITFYKIKRIGSKEYIKNVTKERWDGKRHNGAGTPEHTAWRCMKERCRYNKNSNYHNYGGRGIKVCDRWIDSFENFLEDMGPRPSTNHSLDRINVDGDYEPSNCRWATNEEQQNNKRKSRYITYKGETKTASQWARYLNMTRSCLSGRLNRMDVEEAFTRPVRRRRRKQ